MNATIAASIADGIGKIITATSATVTFNAHTYSAGHGVIAADKRYDESGALDGYTDTYTILQSALTANSDTPVAGNTITTPQGVKRILRVRKDAFGTCVRIDCGDKY